MVPPVIFNIARAGQSPCKGLIRQQQHTGVPRVAYARLHRGSYVTPSSEEFAPLCYFSMTLRCARALQCPIMDDYSSYFPAQEVGQYLPAGGVQ